MAKKKNVSLKDIALKSGVSTALVSYVLNGKAQESRVGKETAERILQVAKELNYQPNLIAKSLRSGRSYTIGLVIADIANPFFANIARIVDDVARKYNYTIIIGSCDENAEKSANVLRVMVNRKVDGFIVVSTEGAADQLRYLQEEHIPFVLLDRHFPEVKSDFVVTDNYLAAYDAAAHLIAGGYRKIGMLAYDTTLFHMKERVDGYLAALNDNGIVPEGDWLRKINQFNVGEETAAVLDGMLCVPEPVDAMIFATNDLAVNAIKYLNRKGLKIPQVFAAVSFGQAEWFDLYQCPISYVKQSVEELATKAVEILIDKFERGVDSEVEQIRIGATLVVRESSRTKSIVK